MEKHEQELRALLLNKTLNDIEIFNTNLNFFSPNEERTWIVDGGIELKIDEDYFSFSYSTENDFFDAFTTPINKVKTNAELQALEAKNADEINNLIGKTITEIEVIWNFYTEFNEDNELETEKKYMPVQMILHFDNHSFLQISGLAYGVRNNELIDMELSSEAELLISVNDRVKI